MMSMWQDEIVENIMAVAEQLGNVVPRKWKNVQALYLKTNESVALPIYSSAPEEAALRIPKSAGAGSEEKKKVKAA